MTWIEAEFEEAARLLEWLRGEERQHGALSAIATRVADSLAQGGRVLSCGNGGSMCDAMHFAEELSGRFRHDRAALAAQAISDPAHLSCVANDYGYDHVFARGVEAWGRAGDVLWALSTSGKSANILHAMKAARERGMTVIGLLGKDGGPAKALCDMSIVVPAHDSGRIQEIHIKVIHLVIDGVERRLFPIRS